MIDVDYTRLNTHFINYNIAKIFYKNSKQARKYVNTNTQTKTLKTFME